MPIKNVTTAGTAVALVVPTGNKLPTTHACHRLTLQWKPTNTSTTKIYVGYQLPHGVSSSVSSTVYDAVLTNAVIGLTLQSKCGNEIDLASIWIDSSANGEGVSYIAEVM